MLRGYRVNLITLYFFFFLKLIQCEQILCLVKLGEHFVPDVHQLGVLGNELSHRASEVFVCRIYQLQELCLVHVLHWNVRT
ncbi:hypothetical protein MT325_M246L [Paramecium bursaria chlorella virus MT325]|uniref:Uncharacterized protein M246L n=1 Tax=Paramecium bursaria Chlorella virus MT325 TaxID=346932 RepID=A7ITX6_PBCVM|nr:hypothetical protein MT325_M246L [Paramecium bursaria chlorella virus MT325]